MTCNVCGCSEYDACINGDGETCSWIAPSLCNFCGSQEDLTLADPDQPLVEIFSEGEAAQFLRCRR